MIDEMVIITDENNNELGLAPRKEMRAKNLWHRSTAVFVFNSKGEIHVHQRTFEKDRCPGYYDMKAGGILTEGETYEINAQRELEEELGIKNTKLNFLFTHKYQDNKGKAFFYAFKCIYDGKITTQKEEVIHGEFMSIEKLKKLMKKEKFTPEGIEMFQKYLEEYHDH